MKCISFCESKESIPSIGEMLDGLVKSYEAATDANEMQAKLAYRRYLLIINCLKVASQFNVEDFKLLMQGQRHSLKSGHQLFYDDVSDEDIEIQTFELIKKIKGTGSKIPLEYHELILDSPIFELRINISGFGFRSILFLASKEFDDIFDQFQCYGHSFRKKRYRTPELRKIGNEKTDQATLLTMTDYQKFKNNEQKFSEAFSEDKVIVRGDD